MAIYMSKKMLVLFSIISFFLGIISTVLYTHLTKSSQLVNEQCYIDDEKLRWCGILKGYKKLTPETLDRVILSSNSLMVDFFLDENELDVIVSNEKNRCKKMQLLQLYSNFINHDFIDASSIISATEKCID